MRIRRKYICLYNTVQNQRALSLAAMHFSHFFSTLHCNPVYVCPLPSTKVPRWGSILFSWCSAGFGKRYSLDSYGETNTFMSNIPFHNLHLYHISFKNWPMGSAKNVVGKILGRKHVTLFGKFCFPALYLCFRNKARQARVKSVFWRDLKAAISKSTQSQVAVFSNVK